MKKKTLILSVIMAATVILAGLSSVVGSSDIEALVENRSCRGSIENLEKREIHKDGGYCFNDEINGANTLLRTKTVTIEVNKYLGGKPEQILTEVSEEEAEEIAQLLLELYDAIERNDNAAILKYENILNTRGIFGDEYSEFYSQDEFLEMVETPENSQLVKRFDEMQGDNISNYVCYYHAAGKGIMIFTLGLRVLEAIIDAIENADSFLEAFVLLIALLPFYVLIALITHIVPFRILLPIGVILMESGKMFSLGLGGFKSVTVEDEPYNVNISWFTGLTVNIPFSENPFLFVSGVAFEVKESGI